MKKVNYGFFNPHRSVEKKPIETKKKISGETYKAVWLKNYYIFRGVSYENNNGDDLDIWGKFLSTDPYFQIVIALVSCWQNTRDIPEELEANIGMMHYINPLVIVSLVATSILVKISEFSDSIKINHPDIAGGLNVFSSLCYLLVAMPLIVVGFISQVLFSLVHAGLSAVFASFSAPFDYIHEIGKVEDDPLLSEISWSM